MIYLSDCHPVVDRGHLAVSGDISVTVGVRGLAATGISCMKGRMAATHPAGHRTAPQPRLLQAKMSLALRLA